MSGKRRALLVATDSYADATFQQLRAPRADTDALNTALADAAIGGYEVEALHNPPAHEANLAIEDLFAAAWLDDLVVLYISGHGIKDDSGQLHLAMTNSRHDRLNATAVSAQFVRNQMDNTRSRRVVVIIDCCFAGAFPPGATHRAGENAGVLSQLGGHGSAVMTSSSALEYSFEAGESASSTVVGTASPSVFTGALVEGLSSGGADRNRDGLIDVDELYDFIYERVEVAGNPQTPGLDIRFQGRLVVATSPVANDLPAEFAQAMRSPLPSVRLAVVGELSVQLYSDSAGAAGVARTALVALTEDDASSVVAAAQAALARADDIGSQSTTVDVKKSVLEGDSAPSPAPPVDAPEEFAGAAPESAASNPTDSPEADRHSVHERPRMRSLSRKQIALIIAVVALVVAVIAAVALVLYPLHVNGDNTATNGENGAPNSDNAAPAQQHTAEIQVPPGFVAPPTRPTPLPDQVMCRYQPDEKEPVRPPADGEVPAKGIVRATINTNMGAIPAILDRSLAPCTVNSVIYLANQDFYDNTPVATHKFPNLFGNVVSRPFPYLTFGPPAAADDGANYQWTDESFPELQGDLRGYLMVDPAYFPDLTVQFGDRPHDPENTVFGTISKEGLHVIDDMRHEDDPSNQNFDERIITSVDVQA